MSASRIVNECIKTWDVNKEDKRIAFFCNTFDDWISQISEKSQISVIQLLQNFNYYSHSLINKQLKLAHLQLIDKLNSSFEYTIFTHMPRTDGLQNSSIFYLVEYNLMNSVDRNLNVMIDINCITLSEWQNIKNIVIIDDILGSGKTLIDFLLKYKEVFSGKKVFFITIHAQVEAKYKVIEFCKESNISIDILYYKEQQKAFDLDFSEEQKQIIINESNTLNIPKNSILGFKGSEALVAFYDNTPNNTLGIFCINTCLNKAIFPRTVHSRPSWKDMKKARNRRKEENYFRKSSSCED
jgi:hypothetical protein